VDISFEVMPGEILDILGQSGSGKSTLTALLNLLPAGGKIQSVQILLKGKDLLRLGPVELQKLRGRQISLVESVTSTSSDFMGELDRSPDAAAVDHHRSSPEQEALRPCPRNSSRGPAHDFSGQPRLSWLARKASSGISIPPSWDPMSFGT
jgi:ABC-type microcin C transport system duplicated ATPase subunit YejF